MPSLVIKAPRYLNWSFLVSFNEESIATYGYLVFTYNNIFLVFLLFNYSLLMSSLSTLFNNPCRPFLFPGINIIRSAYHMPCPLMLIAGCSWRLCIIISMRAKNVWGDCTSLSHAQFYTLESFDLITHIHCCFMFPLK